MNKNVKSVILVIFAIVSVALFVQLINEHAHNKKDIPYSKFLNIVKNGNLKVTPKEPLLITGNNIHGIYIDTATNKEVPFSTYIAYTDTALIQFLKENNIDFKGMPQEENVFWRSVMYILPWIFIIGFFWFFLMKQVQSTGNRALSFGKSRAKLHADNGKKITFNDVAGVDEAKEELKEVVDFLKSPKKFKDIGAKIPTGVLLVGSPGTGKTLLAKACAGEAGVPFFTISGSDFVEMFVGVGASRVRDLFAQAKKNAPCIIFIDEIDAVGRLRGSGMGGGHDEREQTLNQLLVEMDGFEDNEGIIIIAATNRVDVLDPALLRPGRFDRQVVVHTPDLKGRIKILEIHAARVPLADDVSLETVARGTPGFTGADLANVINEAALLTARFDKNKVTQAELEEARDKVLMGPERRSIFISEKEKTIIAYHEAGHALLGTLLEHTEPVHKVTIIPRGQALGLTQNLPTEDNFMRSKKYWLDELVVFMGGRLAEEIQFGDVTTGASNDIERATTIARKMVTEWGMSDIIGAMNLSANDRNAVFIGRGYTQNIEHSNEYAKLVDQEVKKILDTAFNRGKALLKKYQKALDAISKALLDKETVTGDEVRTIVFGKKAATPAVKAKKGTSKVQVKQDTTKKVKAKK